MIFKLLIICTLTISCASQSKIDIDYDALLKQQLAAHDPKDTSSLSEPFRINIEDFNDFKVELLKELLKYPHKFSREQLYRVQTAFNKFSRKHKDPEDIGTPVFHSFHGRWNGRWYQDGKTYSFDHTWNKPEKVSGIVVQRVTTGRWNDLTNIRDNNISAINSYNQKTGLIFGGVDINESAPNLTHAPHLGIYLNSQTLIWIARFDRSKTPYYSFYLENISSIYRGDMYSIKGIGFNWDRANKRIYNSKYKSGLYRPKKTILK